ncbi:TransThyretin family domain [Trichostrongylus colubriformis]|uniref:TransThyretin family domain n=1 Tax=Trichostrongylus colubriformis TaxID=6319 RepID=A0AAN8FP82_TRICO
MHTTSILILALLPVCHGILGLGRLQSVAVTGTLLCKKKPASKVLVKLFDSDVFLDPELKRGRTDEDGTFLISGWKREFTDIEPYLDIYHKCNYEGYCVKRRTIKIPEKYIANAPYPNNTFDLGVLKLEGIHDDQWIDCTNLSVDQYRLHFF